MGGFHVRLSIAPVIAAVKGAEGQRRAENEC
jgi:hypothetical protein